jgi:phospholipase C
VLDFGGSYIAAIPRQGLESDSATFAMAPLYNIALALGIGTIANAYSLADIDHVVLFMQENRAFDHYFGTMAGYVDPVRLTMSTLIFIEFAASVTLMLR